MPSETDNERRAERAYRAVLAHREEGTDIEEAAIDLMTDILHMLPAYGDPEAAHRIAWHHFVAEAYGSEEAEYVRESTR